MALLLLIDTSGNPGTVALALDGRLIALRQNGSERDHAATLNYMVSEVLEERDKSMRDLEGVAVCNGPGSYTGLRIGLASAKGFCYALHKPLLLQNRLQLLANQHRAGHPGADVFLALLKARASEYFTAAYDRSGNELLAPQHFFEKDLEDFLQRCNDRKLVTVTDQPDAFSGAPFLRLESVYSATIDMDYWLMAAEKQFCQEGFASLHLAEPFYLKSAYTTVKIN